MKQFVSPASGRCSDFTSIFNSLVAVSSRKTVGNYQCSEEIVTSLQNLLAGTLSLQELSSMKVLLQAVIYALSFTFMNFTRL